MLAKKKRSFFVFSRQGVGEGGVAKSPNQNCLQKPKNERFFFHVGKNKPKKSLIFEVLKTKGGGEWRFTNCLQKTKYERFFFLQASIKKQVIKNPKENETS